jgi:NADPH-dependent ferric siderophore reductase
VFFPSGETSSVEEFRLRLEPRVHTSQLGRDKGWLDLEFAIHGAPGVTGADGRRRVAAPWAATAEIGAPAGARPAWVAPHLRAAGRLVPRGDETAVPAMRRFARLMDAAATGRILVGGPDAERELPIAAPDGVVVEQVHRGSAPAGSVAARLEALGGGDRPEGDVFAFVAAEQAIVKSGRAC